MVKTTQINSVLVDLVPSSRANATDGYEIDEPPKDLQVATERRLCIDNLFVNYKKHLQERSAYHLGMF